MMRQPVGIPCNAAPHILTIPGAAQDPRDMSEKQTRRCGARERCVTEYRARGVSPCL
jgi:hypothetical protein